jgi:hypothetical protein
VIERGSWLPACLDSIGHRLSRLFDRLGSSLDGVLRLAKLRRTIRSFQGFTFANHEFFSLQRRPMFQRVNRSKSR